MDESDPHIGRHPPEKKDRDLRFQKAVLKHYLPNEQPNAAIEQPNKIGRQDGENVIAASESDSEYSIDADHAEAQVAQALQKRRHGDGGQITHAAAQRVVIVDRDAVYEKNALSKSQRKRARRKKQVDEMKAAGEIVIDRKKRSRQTVEEAVYQTPASSSGSGVERGVSSSSCYAALRDRFRRATEASEEEEVATFVDEVRVQMSQDGAEPHTLHWLQKLAVPIREHKMPKSVVDKLRLIKRSLLTGAVAQAEQLYFSLTVGDSVWLNASKSVMDEDGGRNMLIAFKRLMTYWVEVVMQTP